MLNWIFNRSEMRDNDQTYLSSVFETARFIYYRGRKHFYRYVKNRIKWYIYPRFQKLPKFPDHIDIELSSACNMRCPMCFTTTDEFKTNVKTAVMSFDLFKKIVDEAVAHNVFSIRLSWRGEPTLNPNYIEMIRYAKEKGIKEVSSLTNLLKMTPEMFEEMVDLEMDWLTISFDGMGETYNRIRHPAKFEDAVEKIRKFSEIKKRKKSIKPVVKIQGVWPAVQEDPQAFYDVFRGIVDQVAVNPLLDYLRNDEEGQIVFRENFTCPILWQRFAVGADGLISLCIHDELSHHIIGDINEQSIAEIWNGPELQAARESHKNHQGMSDYKACAECFLPRASEAETTEVDNRSVVVNNMINRPSVVGK